MKGRIVTAVMLAALSLSARAAETTVIAQQEVALVATAGDLVLPSAIYGTRGDAMEQVEEVTAKIAAMLKAGNLKVGDLMRHTIFLKAGSQEPAKIFTRLIGNLRRMGPELTNNPTAGTIVVVPSFPDPNTQLMVELVGGRAPNGMTRVPIMFGPRMSVESIGNERFVASFGLEGLDFYGTGMHSVENLEQEIELMVGNLGAVLGHAGLTLANVVSYNLYVTTGTDPVDTTAKLHQYLRKRLPEINNHPGSGTVVVLNGATLPSLKVQMSIIASRSKPADIARVPQGEVPSDTAAQSATASNVTFVSGMGGVEYAKNGVSADNIAGQAKAAANALHSALSNAGGLKLSDVARFDIYIREGENAADALNGFYKAARALDSSFDPKRASAVVAIVQGFPRASSKILVSAIAARK